MYPTCKADNDKQRLHIAILPTSRSVNERFLSINSQYTALLNAYHLSQYQAHHHHHHHVRRSTPNSHTCTCQCIIDWDKHTIQCINGNGNHLYALLTVSIVLGLSSRLTCSQDICSRSTVHASDTLTRSFARYKFVTYLLTYFDIDIASGHDHCVIPQTCRMALAYHLYH